MKQYYALLIFLLFEYVRPGGFLPILNALRIPTVLAILLFLVSIFSNKFIHNKEVLNKINTKLLMFFLFLILISIFTSDVTYYAFTKFNAVLGYALIYYVMIKQITTLDKLKGVFLTLIVSHLVLVVVSPDIILNPETRSYLNQASFLGDGNDFALSVSIVLPLCLFLFLDAKKQSFKMFSIISFFFLTLCIIGTSSRGGFLSLSGVIIYLWLKSRYKIKGIVAVFALALIVIWFAPLSYFERLKTIENYEEESSAATRIMVWKQAFEMAKAHPILGVGAGHFMVKFGTEFRPPGYPAHGGLPWLNAHSTYFLILGELGFPGIAFLLAIIVGNIVLNEKHIKFLREHKTDFSNSYRRLFISLNAGFIGFSIGGFFLSALYYPHIYILAGISVVAELNLKKIFQHLGK